MHTLYNKDQYIITFSLLLNIIRRLSEAPDKTARTILKIIYKALYNKSLDPLPANPVISKFLSYKTKKPDFLDPTLQLTKDIDKLAEDLKAFDMRIATNEVKLHFIINLILFSSLKKDNPQLFSSLLDTLFSDPDETAVLYALSKLIIYIVDTSSNEQLGLPFSKILFQEDKIKYDFYTSLEIKLPDEYIEHMLTMHSRVRTVLCDDFPQQLHEFYVPHNLIYNSTSTEQEFCVKYDSDINEFYDSITNKNILKGDIGSGKSLFLKYIATKLIFTLNIIPFFISMTQNKSTNIYDCILSQNSIDKTTFEFIIRYHRTLLLIDDGLHDQSPDNNKVFEFIDSFSKKYSKTKIIIVSNLNRLSHILPNDFSILKIMPFDYLQQLDLLCSYFESEQEIIEVFREIRSYKSAIEILLEADVDSSIDIETTDISSEANDVDKIQKVEEIEHQYHKLLEEISSSLESRSEDSVLLDSVYSLNTIMKNPLYLSIFIKKWRSNHNLSGKFSISTLFYNIHCNALLKMKNTYQSMDFTDTLSLFCYFTLQRNLSHFKESDFQIFFNNQKVMDFINTLDYKFDIKEFIDILHYKTGLVTVNDGIYTFINKYSQIYYCSKWLITCPLHYVSDIIESITNANSEFDLSENILKMMVDIDYPVTMKRYIKPILEKIIFHIDDNKKQFDEYLNIMYISPLSYAKYQTIKDAYEKRTNIIMNLMHYRDHNSKQKNLILDRDRLLKIVVNPTTIHNEFLLTAILHIIFPKSPIYKDKYDANVYTHFKSNYTDMLSKKLDLPLIQKEFRDLAIFYNNY